MFKPVILSIAIAVALSPSETQAAESSSVSSAVSSPFLLAAAGDIERITVRGAYFGKQNADSLKTPTLLVDVPQSLSVVTDVQIREQGFQSLADILQYTPGASIGQGEGHRDQMTIRGQNTTADFFIDGLRDDVQYFRPLYNLERVEILRGANALLFGRGGGGGIVNRVTKTASTKETFTALNANIDTFANAVVGVDHNIALNDDQAFRINGFYEQLDNHRDEYDGERFAINPTYSANLSDVTQLVLSYEYIDDDRVVDRGVPSLNNAPLQGVDKTFFGSPDLNVTTLQAHVARARIDHQLNESWSINATLQYADFDKLYQNLYPTGYDAVQNTVSLDGYRDATERENLILQFNAVGQFETGSIEHTLLVGAEHGNQDTSNSRRDTLFVDSNDDQITFAFSDPLVIPAVGFTDFVRDSASDVTFSSVFLQDEIKLNEQFIVVAGLRYDSFDIDVVDAIEAANGTIDGNSGLLGRKDNETSPRLGAIYKPNDDLSFYVSMSKSFLPRSGDQFLSLTPSSQALAPEEFENKEFGIKWNLSDNLSFTTAIFEVTRENGTVTDPNNPENSIITGTKTKGFEIQLVGYVTEKWQVNAGYSNLDADETGRVVEGNLANRVLSQVPENMLTIWNHYQWDDKWAFGLGLIHQSEQYASLNNTVELPDFTRVDAAVYYDITENTKVQLNIENLFDEDYYPAAHNDNNISIGEPLNARVSVSYKF
ncbi:TonB-dependent receptor [Brumicola nitratireducens]|uniref:Putative TonB-dependent receptor n=1 Tax=Glaciecola nitratireducens (strain JCM 12485 / KCTC 12276 / FR1064) TaxID=1085623 RepID=G4QGD9_GLANF|nr:TonB-dependent siderophore receptor [Glaciecola nitratireducens]AEP29464.1 putative TonB-dependent receptor [Glaciecola nitratireducens FR1064]